MAKDYVTFVVDSEISLQDYSVVILEFKNLIEILFRRGFSAERIALDHWWIFQQQRPCVNQREI